MWDYHSFAREGPIHKLVGKCFLITTGSTKFLKIPNSICKTVSFIATQRIIVPTTSTFLFVALHIRGLLQRLIALIQLGSSIFLRSRVGLVPVLKIVFTERAHDDCIPVLMATM